METPFLLQRPCHHTPHIVADNTLVLPLLLAGANRLRRNRGFIGSYHRRRVDGSGVTFCHHSIHQRRQISCSRHPSSCPNVILNDSSSGNADKGVYIDLGSINNFRIDYTTSTKAETSTINLNKDANKNNREESSSLQEWRSNHWIVLIDDEPAIRLAIGDYLHSMGYTVITACEGPMAFLEMMLWSCGWSFLHDTEQRVEDGVVGGIVESPPWITIDEANIHPWRLPNCIISDIRMPGGIDGVQLLGLLRQPPSPITTTTSSKEQKGKVLIPKRKSKRRTASKHDEVDDDHEFDTSIIDGWVDLSTPIAKPSDHAKQILDTIQSTIDYCQQRNNSPNDSRQQLYPNSIRQVPVILLTAKAMVSDRIVGYKAGADGYIPKPFRPDELLGMVDNLMRRQERERVAWMESNNADDLTSGEELSPKELIEVSKELIGIKRLLRQRLNDLGS